LELNSLIETSLLEDVQLYATLKIIESVHLTGSLFSDTAANLNLLSYPETVLFGKRQPKSGLQVAKESMNMLSY